MRPLILSFVLIVCASCAFAQQTGPNVDVNLSVARSSYYDESAPAFPLDDFKVIITKNGKRERVVKPEAFTDSVAFRLGYGHLYQLDIRRRGLCQKSISISTEGITDKTEPVGFTLVLDFTLHPDLNRAQKKLLRNELIGKAAYDPVAENIIFDFDYTKSMKVKLKALGDHP